MLQNYNGYRVLELFLENPTYMFSWTEISQKLKLGPVSVKQYIIEMEKEGLILIKEFKKTKLYQANRDSFDFKNYKSFGIIRKIKKSGLFEYIDEKLDYPTIIIYGSAAKGEDTEKSDIDIAIVCLKKTSLEIEEFEKKIDKNIQLMVIEKKELKNIREKNKELLNSISNGIVIKGFLEVI